jgi:hypothetical protein
MNSIFEVYFAIYAMFAVLGIYLSSYFRFDPTATISVVVEDGWCNAKEQGIGLHCFGDFYYTLGFVNLPNPWIGSPFPYPPLAAFLFKPFVFLFEQTPNTPWALLTYLFVLAIAIVFVPYHISKKFQFNHRNSFVVFAFTISATPILIAMDRGNVIILIFPLMYLFLMAEIENRSKVSFIFWVMMVLIKPQMSILGLIYFRNKQIKRGMINLSLGFILFLCSFILYPSNIVGNVKSFFSQLIFYQDYVVTGMLYPINVSMGNTLSLLQRIFFDSVPSSTVLNLLSLILLVSIALKSYFAPSKPSIQIISLLALAVILFPQVSFSYYLILLLPVLLIAISTHIDLNRIQKVRSLSTLEFQVEHLFESKWIRYFLLLYLLPIQIPLSLFMDVTAISTNLAISFHWIFLQVGLIVLSIYLLGWKREHKV